MIFPDSQEKWHHVCVVKYKEEFFISHVDGDNCGLEVLPNKRVKAMDSFGVSYKDDGRDDPQRVWSQLILAIRKWMKTVVKDWIKANKHVLTQYPLHCRYGIVPHSLIQESLADFYRLDKDLGRGKTRRFIQLVEEGFCLREENSVRESMTANDFFNYCRIAYLASKRKNDSVDEEMSGRKMYESYADGRHQGLLDIDPNSEQEFADWIDGKHPKYSAGGHRWEIKRGGNTTHIDLSAHRPSFHGEEKFKIELRGQALHRLKETIQMFLAIQKKGLPIAIADPEGVRQRLLAQDNIGIVPAYDSLHRANQRFNKEDHVYDVMHLDEIGRYKRRITPFITWKPLPILKPRDI